jgi:outer membrane lipoprotein SlyB
MNTQTPASPGAVPPAPGMPMNRWMIGGAGLLAGGALAAAIMVSPLVRGPAPTAEAAGPATTTPAGKAAPATPAAAPKAAGVPAPQRAAAAPAEVCASCGTVESVVAVQQKGEGSGVGAVAGGVIGGVLGNQIGGGTGKTVATVVGAVGGGMAGHEIEKQARATTAYQVRVRMDDGTLRTVTQKQNLAVGARVNLTAQGLRSMPAGS